MLEQTTIFKHRFFLPVLVVEALQALPWQTFHLPIPWKPLDPAKDAESQMGSTLYILDTILGECTYRPNGLLMNEQTLNNPNDLIKRLTGVFDNTAYTGTFGRVG